MPEGHPAVVTLRRDPIRLRERHATLDAEDVAEGMTDDPLHGIHGAAAVVGRHHDILHLEERVVPVGRLLGEHVKARAGDFFPLKRFDQRRLIHHTPPSGVSENGRRLHQSESVRPDHSSGLRHQGKVERYDV